LSFEGPVCLAVAGLLLVLAPSLPASPPELPLEQAWPIDGPGRFQPSGLLLREGVLWTVCDKDGSAIFRLQFLDESVQAMRGLEIRLPAASGRERWLDLEGIGAAPDGGFFLVSEELVRIVHVSGGGEARILPFEIDALGRSVGLFAQHNATLEGLALLDDGAIVLAAERQPRGLVELSGEPPHRISALRMDGSDYPVAPGRSPDFADLCVWRGRLFALVRNQHLVVELIRHPDGSWREGEAWSYASTENSPEFRYHDDTYGLAEGLAISDDRIYIVMDNNDDTLARDATDARPRLFAFTNVISR
jgi:hypothetical protein